MTDRRQRERRKHGALPKFRCPICDGIHVTKVIESRPSGAEDQYDYYWRRRACAGCGESFTTTETVMPVDRPAKIAPHLEVGK